MKGNIHTCGTPSSNNLPVSVNKCARKSTVQKLVVQIGTKITDGGQLVGPPEIVPIHSGAKTCSLFTANEMFFRKIPTTFQNVQKIKLNLRKPTRQNRWLTSHGGKG